MVETTIITTNDLYKSFGTLEILKGVNLEVTENSIYGFLGPNGAGKTTTIKILLGLLKPTSGTVKVFNQNFHSNHLQIKQDIGYLPQHPQFYDFLSARDILEYTMKFYFTGPKVAIQDRIELVLDLVSISHRADRTIRGFSGGERRRLGIAQAMINFPKLLILDEPAAALDPVGRRDVLSIMEDLRDYTTIFYSTHILDDVQKISDRVAILNHGSLIAEGEIETLIAGSDGIVYDLSFTGNADNAQKRLADYDWLSIQQSENNGLHSWKVAVADQEKAEMLLLRKLLEDPELRVASFQKKKFELEDIFMKLVEEER